MRRRDTFIFAGLSLAGVAILVSSLAWSGQLRASWSFLFAFILLQICVLVYLAIDFVRTRKRFQKQLAALEIMRQRREEEEAQQQARKREQDRLDGLVQDYREKLCADPAVTQIQILQMAQPVELNKVYTPLRLHIEARLSEPYAFPFGEAQNPEHLLRTSLQETEQTAGLELKPAEAIQRFKRCVILGSPGAGKTTLLNHLALQAARSELARLPSLPVHINLYDFVHTGERDLLRFATQIWQERYQFPADEALPYLKSCLQAGRTLVLLDGLDETRVGGSLVEAEAAYRAIIEAIEALVNDYPNIFIVVTARTAGYRQRLRLQRFVELELLDLNARDIKTFVLQWTGANELARTVADELARTIQQNPAARVLAARPLLLALILILYEKKRGALPLRRADLYERCVRLLLDEWESDQRREVFHIFKQEKKRKLLEKVAWHFLKQRKQRFPTPELLDIIVDTLKTMDLGSERDLAPVILQETSLDTGLLREVLPGWYAFWHLTFQEYFAARRIDDMQNDGLPELMRHLYDPWWEEVVLLYISITRESDAIAFFKRLLNQDYAYVEDEPELYLAFLFDLVLAGKCLVARPDLEDLPLRQQITQHLLSHLQNAPLTVVRQQLAESLVTLDKEPINQALLDILRNTDEHADLEVQMSIVRAVGLYASRPMVEELEAMLFDEYMPTNVRLEIIQVLATIRWTTDTSRFIHYITQRRADQAIRLGIAQALGTLIADEHSALEVIRLLDEEKIEMDLRCALVDALGECGQPVSAAALRRIAEQERPGGEQIGSRYYAHLAVALAALGEEADLTALLARLNTPGRGRGFDSEVSLKMDIVQMTGMLGSMHFAQVFLPFLANEGIHWNIRVRMLGVLGILGDFSVLPSLISLLERRATNKYVQAAAATVAGLLGDARLVGQLQLLCFQMTDEKYERSVYRSLITARCRLGDPLAVDAVLSWLTVAIDPEVALDSEEERHLSVDERLQMLDTLEALGRSGRLEETHRQSVFQALCALIQPEKSAQALRQASILILPWLVRSTRERERLRDLLLGLRDDPSIQNEVYRVLWMTGKHWLEDGVEAGTW